MAQPPREEIADGRIRAEIDRAIEGCQGGFEIVRRRLFTTDIDYPARDAVVNAFVEMYRSEKNEFPLGVADSEYAIRMKSAYPIHPELFDRLYEDWSTLDRFQRTRGVLRLMATCTKAMRDYEALA